MGETWIGYLRPITSHIIHDRDIAAHLGIAENDLIVEYDPADPQATTVGSATQGRLVSEVIVELLPEGVIGVDANRAENAFQVNVVEEPLPDEDA